MGSKKKLESLSRWENKKEKPLKACAEKIDKTRQSEWVQNDMEKKYTQRKLVCKIFNKINHSECGGKEPTSERV